jgi:hypothetical protein
MITTHRARIIARRRAHLVAQSGIMTGRHVDPLTGAMVREATPLPDATGSFPLVPYPIPLDMISTGELVIPAYPYGMPDAR